MSIANVQWGTPAATTSGGGTTPCTITPTLPVAAHATNLVIACIVASQNANGGGAQHASALAITTPSGWNPGAVIQGANSFPIAQYFWRYGFSGTSQAFTITSTVANVVGAVAILAEFSGADTVNPILQSGENQQIFTLGTLAGPPLTPQVGGMYALLFAAEDDDPIDAFSTTPPSGWTIRVTTYAVGGNQGGAQVQFNAAPVRAVLLTPHVTINDTDVTANLLMIHLLLQPPVLAYDHVPFFGSAAHAAGAVAVATVVPRFNQKGWK